MQPKDIDEFPEDEKERCPLEMLAELTSQTEANQTIKDEENEPAVN